MATYASCYALTSARQKSNPSYSTHTARVVGAEALFTASGLDVLSNPLSMGRVLPSAWGLDRASPASQPTCPFRSFVGLADTTTPAQYSWILGAPAQAISSGYYIDATPASASAGNSIQWAVSEGRMSPRPSVQAEDTDNISRVAGLLTWSDVIPYTSHQNIIVFDEFPPATIITGGGYPSTLLRQLYIDPPSRLMAGSTPLDFCSAYGIAPDGTIWIDPADIGSGPDQIPAGVEDNTAEAFMAHPSVFIPAGASRYIRSVERMAIDTSPIDITFLGQPLRIKSVSDAPVVSVWLVAIDGAETIVTLRHPTNSNYRRPKDIWNNVIVPLINGSQIGSTLGFADADALASSANLKYSNYWRCLEIANDGDDVTQGDSTPPG